MGLTAGLTATGGTTLRLDTARIESALARKIANDEQRAAAEAIRLEQLSGHKSLLLSIVSNQSLLKLLVVTGRSLSICPYGQDNEGNLNDLYLRALPIDGKDNRDARAQRQLALCAGPHGIPITAERIVSGGADQMVEHLFSKNALVDPIKAKNPKGWLSGERTLTGADLIGAINLAIKELELTLK